MKSQGLQCNSPIRKSRRKGPVYQSFLKSPGRDESGAMPDDGYCERYCSWEEAEAGHQKAIELVFEV